MNLLFPNFDRVASDTFSTSYKCYSVSFFPGNLRDGVEKGGKIIMPPSTLGALSECFICSNFPARMNVQYPMLFKLTNQQANRTTHCGVLEFVADEGNIYVPYWMLKNLLLEEGERVYVSNVSLKVASFARFQPQCGDFLDISNPKAVLENALRDFACLTVGDVIAISYNDNVYELKVLETKPDNAVTIIECDMSVDFAPPVGYGSENKREAKDKLGKSHRKHEEDDNVVIPGTVHKFQAFCGTGHRLDGKGKPPISPGGSGSSESTSLLRERGIPNYAYQPGSLTFLRNSRSSANEEQEAVPFKPFGGTGHQLKAKDDSRT
ncbi:Ubiquitin fusion degradation protein 1 [Fasciola gigantica]|uniref:Ubiquitin fusion degradation protein 1 n=1 Tax=Fasciola gigantica TaxID=46835 RepID=A0A504YVW3_FASGI|nr:Ubiquitin fusion degradation protein 1 [Fasciola gigantica]